MKLRKTSLLTAAPIALAASFSAQAEEPIKPQTDWEVSGLTRILIESGDLATNLSYPEAVINAKNGHWEIQLIPDITDRTPQTIGGKLDLRANTATLAYRTEDTITKVGMLPPFGRRLTGAEFERGMMGAYLSDQLNIQGGVIGLQHTQTFRPNANINITMNALAGTKIEDISKFGDPQGPGFSSEVLGTGLNINTNLPSGITLSGAYNYTYFGEGPANQNLESHYFSGAAIVEYNDVKWQILSEIETTSQSDEMDYVLMGQAIGSLSNYFGWRTAIGIANDNPAAEAYLTYRNGKFRMQAGGALVRHNNENEGIFNVVFARDF